MGRKYRLHNLPRDPAQRRRARELWRLYMRRPQEARALPETELRVLRFSGPAEYLDGGRFCNLGPGLPVQLAVQMPCYLCGSRLSRAIRQGKRKPRRLHLFGDTARPPKMRVYPYAAYRLCEPCALSVRDYRLAERRHMHRYERRDRSRRWARLAYYHTRPADWPKGLC